MASLTGMRLTLKTGAHADLRADRHQNATCAPTLRIQPPTKAFLRGTSHFGSTSTAGKGRACTSRSQLTVRSKFDPETMEVLGIPGVKVIPDDGTKLTRGEDGMLEKKIAGLQGQGTSSSSSKDKDIPLELSWDPNSEFGGAEHADDLIEKNLMKRQQKEMEELAAKEKEEYEKARKELEEFRAARVQPEAGDVAGIVQYIRDTEFQEMEYELIRLKPVLDDAFFSGLQALIDGADEEEREVLLTIQQKTAQLMQFVEKNVEAMAAPAERLRDLLMSKDKKAKIQEMGESGQFDMPFLALLQTNINGARAAGQEEAVDFMQKIYNVCTKYVDVPEQAEVTEA